MFTMETESAIMSLLIVFIMQINVEDVGDESCQSHIWKLMHSESPVPGSAFGDKGRMRMKKRLAVGVLGMMTVLLSACGTQKEDNVMAEDRVETEIILDEVEEEPVPADVPSEEERKDVTEPEAAVPLPDGGTEKEVQNPSDSNDGYKEIYRLVVEEQEGDALGFSLIYLDDDDIPELVVCDRGYGTYSVYTVKDGVAFCMIDSMTTVELSYFEHRGVVSQFARWNGGGDEGGYGSYYYQVIGEKTLTDGDVPVLHYSYDAVYDEEGSWTGEGVTKYYYMEQEIEEADYQKRISELGIAEGTEKPCEENALGKEEMLDQLGSGSAQ